MKQYWNTILEEEIRKKPGCQISRKRFGELLGICWTKKFSSASLISGFESCGIFPIDRLKFPQEAYDPIKLRRFQNENQPNLTDGLINQSNEPEKNNEETKSSANFNSFEDFIRISFSIQEKINTSLNKRKKIPQNQYGEVLTSNEVINRLIQKKVNVKSKKIKLS